MNELIDQIIEAERREQNRKVLEQWLAVINQLTDTPAEVN